MKRILVCLLALPLCVASAPAATVFTDDFSYADGNLDANPPWVTHSGTGVLPLAVANGAASIVHGGGSRDDVNRPFADVSQGVLQYAFDLVVRDDAPILGGDNEYFAHFTSTPDNGINVDFDFTARLDVVAATGGTGDYSLGIATEASTAEAVTTSVFTFGDVVPVLVSYDFATLQASLTVGGETVFGLAGTGLPSLNTFALRQSTSSSNESILVDNLVVTAVPEPSIFVGLGVLGAIVTGGRQWRRRKVAKV